MTLPDHVSVRGQANLELYALSISVDVTVQYIVYLLVIVAVV